MCSNQLSYVATKSLRLRSGAYYADLGFCRQQFYDIKLSVWLDTKQVETIFLFGGDKITNTPRNNRYL
ncbi:hypothetical protein GARC_4705 [Paraglaciecola arctica BSs20135]|uniref:Uncharacterized protein n=1 Tax=Paraglaciecola arctica BSs20135 TaxID=493475 RepID=K6YY11_9ALTE|nr:hypothetical protein GARC_4705 [Paraglaciecola arctica BSs20135]